jgi:hypothetical protein
MKEPTARPALAEQGQKYDHGKVRIELFPGDALFAISDILTLGAQKYADRNWELGMSWGRPFGAMMRHMWAWWQGKCPTHTNFLFGDFDPEWNRSHLWHAGCCLVFLIAYEMRGIGTDDRPKWGEGNLPTTMPGVLPFTVPGKPHEVDLEDLEEALKK